MSLYTLDFQDIDKTKLIIVGGKGINLGELSKIKGIEVPQGFCVSTNAFKRIIGELTAINELFEQLASLKISEKDRVSKISAKIRKTIEQATIPNEINKEISEFILRFGKESAYAIRSSATAEDLPNASFAGQQDTYLNISGEKEILKHISKCWASLFTERAIIYRIQNGFDHRKVFLSVVIQKMIFSEVSGILFTADPITGNRKVSSIDASFGLGESLVSGLVNPDMYKVQGGEIIQKKIANKTLAIYPIKDGGTGDYKINDSEQNKQVLTDEQILQLEQIGKRIEKHFASPQDIEWCLFDNIFYIVQSRPITNLYPVPKITDEENHVYLSVGHQQMMTDAIKPLGISLFQLTAFRPMLEAGGRLFVDATSNLSLEGSRKAFVNAFGKADPLTGDALRQIIEREGFIKILVNDKKEQSGNKKSITTMNSKVEVENNKEIVSDLIKMTQASIEELKENIQMKSGVDLFDFILEDIKELKRILFNPQSSKIIMAGMNASSWVNDKMEKHLGEKNIADTLSQSVENNITSEMGLDLLDISDMISPYPEVINYLQSVEKDDFLDELVKFNSGIEIKNAIYNYLDKYGMRCGGEIDITKTRWSEKPSTIIPMILNNIKNFKLNKSQKFEEGLKEALDKEKEVLYRLEKLPNSKELVKETKQMINTIRDCIGYREYPKYGMISRYFVYKKALMKEAEKLVQMNLIYEKEDIYYLTLEEFKEVVREHKLAYQIINKRKEEYRLYEKLTPPRVMTSDGEIISGSYKKENIPSNALVGLAVSSGIIEGRARVILNMEEAELESGDILITKFTDPSWTPLFVSIKGLVTEVGGLMTHGAVIAREYGLPAVVSVENATKLIKDGQQIRVHGTEGYIELL